MTLEQFFDQFLLTKSLADKVVGIAWFWSKHEQKQTFTFPDMTATLTTLRVDQADLHITWRDLCALRKFHVHSHNVYCLDRALEKELDKDYYQAEATRPGSPDHLLDQAEDRLAHGDLAQAAAVAGAAIETHLRNVISKSGSTPPVPGSISIYKEFIARERKAGSLMAFLDRDLSHITGWGQDRNAAAHQPTAFTRNPQNVRLMIDGIRDLVSRTK
jgi:hypothetical protein